MNRRHTDRVHGAVRAWLWPLMLVWGAVAWAGLSHVHIVRDADEGQVTTARETRCVGSEGEASLVGRADAESPEAQPRS